MARFHLRKPSRRRRKPATTDRQYPTSIVLSDDVKRRLKVQANRARLDTVASLVRRWVEDRLVQEETSQQIKQLVDPV